MTDASNFLPKSLLGLPFSSIHLIFLVTSWETHCDHSKCLGKISNFFLITQIDCGRNWTRRQTVWFQRRSYSPPQPQAHWVWINCVSHCPDALGKFGLAAGCMISENKPWCFLWDMRKNEMTPLQIELSLSKPQTHANGNANTPRAPGHVSHRRPVWAAVVTILLLPALKEGMLIALSRECWSCGKP